MHVMAEENMSESTASRLHFLYLPLFACRLSVLPDDVGQVFVESGKMYIRFNRTL